MYLDSTLMSSQKQTSREYFKAFTIIHFALLMGQVVFASVVYYLISSGSVSNKITDLDEVFIYAAPLAVLGGIAGSIFVTKQRLGSIPNNATLEDKLFEYRAIVITKLAMLEGPAFFAIICYYLTSNLLYLGLVPILLVVFVLNRPTASKAVQDLSLNQQERALVEDPNGVLF